MCVMSGSESGLEFGVQSIDLLHSVRRTEYGVLKVYKQYYASRPLALSERLGDDRPETLFAHPGGWFTC